MSANFDRLLINLFFNYCLTDESPIGIKKVPQKRMGNQPKNCTMKKKTFRLC